ncbi:hypothetical protein DFH28DRAFT_924855 [Melampsora americana]|nr:hypothetical protein DFH28DRAFT_924855 [Melampsora americana]
MTMCYTSGLEPCAMEPNESATSVCRRPLVIHLDKTVSAPPPKPTVACQGKIRCICPDDYKKDGLDSEKGKRQQAIQEAQEAAQPQSTGKELLIINLGPDEVSPVFLYRKVTNNLIFFIFSITGSIANNNPKITLKRRGICLDAEDIHKALKEQFGLEIEPASDSEYVYAMPDEPSHELVIPHMLTLFKIFTSKPNLLEFTSSNSFLFLL